MQYFNMQIDKIDFSILHSWSFSWDYKTSNEGICSYIEASYYILVVVENYNQIIKTITISKTPVSLCHVPFHGIFVKPPVRGHVFSYQYFISLITCSITYLWSFSLGHKVSNEGTYTRHYILCTYSFSWDF